MNHFFCIYTFPVNEFVLQALFTKKQDAEDFIESNHLSLDDNARPGRKAFLVEMALPAIVDSIIQERLGKLYAPLMKLAGLPIDIEEDKAA